MGAVDGTVTLGERLNHDVFDAQVVEADGDRADIDDGVDGAHLVEHDGLGRFAVCLGLGGSQRGKDGESAALGTATQLRAVDDGGDVCQRTVVMVVGVMVALVAMTLMVVLVAVVVLDMVVMMVLMLVHMLMVMLVLDSSLITVEPGHIVIVVLEFLCQLDVEIAGVDAMLVCARDGNRKAADRQRGKLFAQVLLAGAQVEQSRDGHIAADARGAVDDKRVLMVGHGMLLSGRRACRRSDD